MAEPTRGKPLTIVIGTPLEREHVERIAAAMPERVRVLYAPELLPVPKYVADHGGQRRDLSAADKQRWLDMLAEADIMFDFDWFDPANLPTNAPRLRWIQGTSAGIGEAATRTGLIRSSIELTTAAGVHAESLSEFTLLGLLYFFRDVPRLNAMKQAHRWERFTNRALYGTRLLLVGLGGVGGAVARRCADFGVEVWAIRRSQGGAPPEGVRRLLPMSELRSALGEVESLVLTCPLTPETRHLIGEAELRAMRPDSVLVNIARGQVVVEPALIAALKERRIAGAALDVFYKEPLPPDNPLWDLPNVLFSPHSASTVHAENGRIVDLFIDNLRRFVEGRKLRNVFDKARAY